MMRMTRLDEDGHPMGETVEVPVESAHFRWAEVDGEIVGGDWSGVDLGQRYMTTMTIPMRLTKHGQRVIWRLVYGQGGPWKAAHARRYRRRRTRGGRRVR